MSRQLALFTNTYPYGTAETFLEQETPIVFGEFEKVHIFPMYIPQGDNLSQPRNVPSNAVVHKPLLPFDHKDKWGLLTGGIFSFAPLMFTFKEFVGKKIYRDKGKGWIWANYMCIIRSILGNRGVMKEVVQVLENCSAAYFYWGDKSALMVPFLKKRMGRKAPKFVVRFHGSDLYEHAKGYLPFREMLYGATDYAVPISDNGAEYIRENYSNQPGETKVFRLGSFYHSDACPNLGAPVPMAEGAADCQGAYNILSCSNVIELKRVHLLAVAMLYLERDAELAAALKGKGISHICWTHIGDGPLMSQIKEMVMDSGVPEDYDGELTPVAFNFAGAMPHDKVMEYYQTHYTDLFVQVSRSEGIPVSIMEALSYGTPVMATDVGGVSQLLPEGCGCGKLVACDITAESLANELKDWILTSMDLPEFELALAARRQWEANWDSRKNYASFAAWLKSIE